MSRRGLEPVKVPPGEAKPDDVLVVVTGDSWVATRFALPPFYLQHMRHALRHKLMLLAGANRYRIDSLPDAKRAELFALLHEQGCQFEVWR